jgi:hypothetical protein
LDQSQEGRRGGAEVVEARGAVDDEDEEDDEEDEERE